MQFDIITIFPDFFSSILAHGVLKRALATNLLRVETHNLRDFAHDRHRTVDDRPFGGGEGMVLKPEPLAEVIESLQIAAKPDRNPAKETVVLLSAQGARFAQSTARELATLDRVVLICGRYEGVDERVAELLCDDELSIGDYVLSGGELGAAVIVDAVVRLLPGVLGHADSSRYESFGEGDEVLENCHPERSEGPASSSQRQDVPRSTHGSGGLLDYPHYTRPAEFRGTAIPEVLGNGDHSVIRKWRRQAALAKTFANRPDLLASADLSDDDRELLAGMGFQAD